MEGSTNEELARSVCNRLALALGGELGAGAFKQTFLVTDKSGQRFALKIVTADFDSQRLAREVAAMKKCSHAGIARLVDYRVEPWSGHKFCWLLEEFIAGGTLRSRLNRLGTLPLEEIRSLGIELSSALAHIASLNLVHRDLKPDNIMYRKMDGLPVIVDFGLVRNLQDVSLTKTWLAQGPGTPYYSPPEQLVNQKELIDWRSDQFSLGITLALAGSGHHPYAALTDTALGHAVERVANREDTSVEFKQWVKDSGLTVLARMVRPWPVQRYRRPEDLVSAWGK